ncbi:hypothetical protein [Rubripirellula reticaptiva]|uniref:Uncharacterized protein n=1 Tax=Rubripirellula reticaptiva TaxID=2528013 RepID=A0A5C6EDX8_9BACT|nr:hypothetical protein [Rubripirellula reticaptiva]TWU46644.1 hypothetical protein Poly59_56170 [Rubripirellula reticaptiva]
MERHIKRRRRIIGLGGLAIGALLALIWFFASPRFLKPSTLNFDSARNLEVAEPVTITHDFDPTVANPSLSPEDVVRLQLESLQETAERPERLIVCFSLASPENRMNTGPLSRFAELIRDDAYRPLLGHQNAMIGRAKVIDGQAAVMATIIAVDDQAYAFEFLLSRYRPNGSTSGPLLAEATTMDGRQPDDDSSKCWMTDGVYPVFVADVSAVNSSGVEE